MIGHDEMMGIIATEAAEAAAGSPPRTGSEADEVIMRLRKICERPYVEKHGRPLTWDRGWCWEMVSFIHHAVDAYKPPNSDYATNQPHIAICEPRT